MRIICFDPVAGASGDMTLAALLDLGVDPQVIETAVKSMGLAGFSIRFERRPASDRMIYAFCNVDIEHEHEHEHEHRNLADIMRMIEQGDFAERAKSRAIGVFRCLAEAEAKAHGIPVEHVHFHEVGAVDSIVDITGACVALEILGVDMIYTAPLKIGHGVITCAHGVIPSPAPATVNLLGGWPFERLDIEAELTTPTGAALLTSLSSGVWTQLCGRCLGCGHGHGTLELTQRPNVLRAFLLETDGPPCDVCEVIECEIDDATAEVLADVTDHLRLAGALDVLVYGVSMKKGRHGTALRVLCEVRNTPELVRCILSESSSIGVRISQTRRVTLQRQAVEVESEWGPIVAKKIVRPDGSTEIVPEYEACRRLAERERIPIRRIYESACWRQAAAAGTFADCCNV